MSSSSSSQQASILALGMALGMGIALTVPNLKTKIEEALNKGEEAVEFVNNFVSGNSSSSTDNAGNDKNAAKSNNNENTSANNESPETDKPDNANDDCVGIESEQAGSAPGCAGCPNQSLCQSGEAKKVDPAALEIKEQLQNVKHKILILSGKGGVGKSTVSAQLSFHFSEQNDVGLLDIDITGPSLPRMLGLSGQDVHQSVEGWSPVYVNDRLGVMSIGFMLPNEDDPIIWRGPRKNGLIRQFLTDVNWGNLDYLFIDTPPGTSDEHLSIVTYLSEAKISGAVIVTTPQEVALTDVKKEINFCRKTNIPILGVVENMGGFLGLDSTNVKKMCTDYNIAYLGRVPLHNDVGLAGEKGHGVTDPKIKEALSGISNELTGNLMASIGAAEGN